MGKFTAQRGPTLDRPSDVLYTFFHFGKFPGAERVWLSCEHFYWMFIYFFFNCDWSRVSRKRWNSIFGLNLLLHMFSIMSSWNSLQWNFRTCFHLRQCYKCLEKDGCDYKDTRLGSFCQFLLLVLMKKGHIKTHLQLFLQSGYWWNNWW